MKNNYTIANNSIKHGDDKIKNPLLNALPCAMSPSDIILKTTNNPEYDSSYRLMSVQNRIYQLSSLSNFFFPMPITLRIANSIDVALRSGYQDRNPLSNEMARFYNENYCNLKGNEYHRQYIDAKTVPNLYIVGPSGVGKSTNLSRVLKALYPQQVIEHTEFNGKPFIFKQIVYIKVIVPFDGSVKGILLNLFSELDKIAGTDYFQKVTKAKATVDHMLIILSNISPNIGMLVVDEIQNINMQKSSGAERVMNFFTNLSNLGLPIVLVGTPKCLNLMKLDFKQARRSIGIGGNIIVDRLKRDDVWEAFVESVWAYQYLDEEVLLTQDFVDVLYEHSQGIPDLFIKLYQSVQMHCLINHKSLTTKMVTKVFNEQFFAVHAIIKALKTNNASALASYEDVWINMETNASQISRLNGSERDIVFGSATIIREKKDIRKSQISKITKQLDVNDLRNIPEKYNGDTYKYFLEKSIIKNLME